MLDHWVRDTPYLFALALAACVSALIVAVAWRRRKKRGGLYLALMLTASFLWVLFYTFELAFPSLGMKLLWDRLEYLGVVPVSVFWFLFARANTDPTRRLSAVRLSLLCAVPVITLGLVATNGFHRLIWRGAAINSLHSVPVLVFSYGPWFWVHVAYSYGLVVAGLCLLVGAAHRYPLAYRGQARLFVLAVLVPWIGNIVGLFVLRARGIDPTPFAFVFAGLLLMLAYSSRGLHSLLPSLLLTARDHVLEKMKDGVVVLDVNWRVVSMNAAATELLAGHGVVLGQRPGGVLSEAASAIAASRDADELHSELVIEDDGGSRHLDVVSTRLPGKGGGMGWVLALRDVTESREALEALRQGEARYRDLVEASHDWIWEVDEQGRYSFASPKVEQVLGYQPAEVVGRRPIDLMPAGEGERVGAVLRQLVDNCTPYRDLENVIRHKDGHLVTLETTGTPIFDETGAYRGYRGTDRDVTLRKEMERAFRLTQLSVDVASDSIFWVDAEGRFIYVNDASCRRLGYEREELLSMSVDDVDPSAPGPWGEHFQQVKDFGSRRHETVHRTKDGRLFPVEVMINYVFCDGREYLFAYARDISEQKKNEGALRESEGRFRAVFDNTATGVAMMDSDGRAFRSNPALVRMLGYSAAELSRLPLVNITHEEDVERESTLLRELVQGARDHYQLEKRFLRKGGEPFWVQMTGSLVRDDAGEPLCGIAVVVDIAERKEAERALAESEEQLRQAQKMEAVGQLAGGIAHDFNNLLMVIIGNASLALVGAELEDPRGRFLTDIKEAGERAAGLTRQILAFSRRQILQPRVLQLNEVVTGMDPLLRRTLGEHIDLVMLLTPDL
jgi:two-component system, cell cycle sensor histidine kinase and response regulator CckA